MSRITLKNEPKLIAKHKAFEFQSEAFNSIRDLEFAAIFHEQGLGKSKIAIDLMLYWLEKKIIDTVVFVAKRNLIFNWCNEFAEHTHMKPVILSQNKKNNFYAFNSPSRLILTHYEVFKSEKERLILFLKARDVGVILDESAKIKNPNSSISRVFLEIAPLFKRRIIITGTPVANRPYDVWSQIWFLDLGVSLGSDYNNFKSTSDLTNTLKNDKNKRNAFENSISTLFDKISSFTVRKTKDSGVIKLPNKVINTIKSDWESRQYELYFQVQKEMRAIIIENGILKEDDSEVVLKRLLRLVQIASNPKLVDDGYNNEPGKIEYLDDIVDSIILKKEKCIIWSSFTKNVEWLFKKYNRFGCRKIHGKISIEDRNRSLKQFMNDKETRILIATPGAAKEGLTLTVANHVIFYDRNFSLDDYLQSQDRIHRISQEKQCHVYNIIMNNSIDEWVDILLHSKHLTAKLSQGDISLQQYKNSISYDYGEMIKNILKCNQ